MTDKLYPEQTERPIPERCQRCGGRGYVFDPELDGEKTCRSCWGQGYVLSRTRLYVRCKVCSGQGKHFDPDIAEGWRWANPWHSCENCMGHGWTVRERGRLELALRLWQRPDPENPNNYPMAEEIKEARRDEG